MSDKRTSLRGGAWYGNLSDALSSLYWYKAESASERVCGVGFRCVRGGFPEHRSIRGGVWNGTPEFARDWLPAHARLGVFRGTLGFRCVRREP
jgi:formylglycine-generating enzyme required for sulfatase activity